MPSAIDTNVLIRFLVDDGSEHVAPARRLLSSGQFFVSLSVMLETEWVLRSYFGFQRAQICDAFDRVLGFDAMLFQERRVLENAVEACRAGMDFADALHLNTAVDCDVFYTFDKKLIRNAERNIPNRPVREP
ncbi:putative nucleic-acid-binding protein [Mesorhizobium sp. J18]|uniref:type II toxin-antitoxin system VapC family toxin n=1 Tax=Mesorhizobium sp. J18 TaxID=935263 RepID=UPI00119C1945|nr:type II toxin-antitoxin system VapC family toxin [Mesorhizobium sp. J18]TWH01085.1 putative nucleic-acid-binding protein [Mesorhizobium sp. J18]